MMVARVSPFWLARSRRPRVRTDGWQRLRLRVSGSDVVGNFGGTFGVDDGMRFTSTVTPRLFGQVFLNYRECIVTNANMRPLVIDQLEVYPTFDCDVTTSGVGSPTVAGTPAIGTAGGPPCVGNSTFEFTAANMIPGGISLIVLGLGPAGPGVPVPGAPAALQLYVAPTVIGTVLNSAGGSATSPLGIPATNSLVGTVISGQFFDLDVTLGTALPFGSSDAATITLGNG